LKALILAGGSGAGLRPISCTRPIKNPVSLGRGVSIGKNLVVEPHVVLGDDIVVGSNVRIKDSVILPSVMISDFSSVNGAIIDEGATIRKKVKIEKGCIIGDLVKINNDVSLPRNLSVCPAKKISESVSTSKSII
jgi:NDP-sugar pyrophosphorylase family protein